MVELSSNWRNLQARLKIEEASKSTSKRRKADERPARQAKRQKVKAEPSAANPKQDKNLFGRPEMGGVLSSAIEHESRHGPSPSLTLWAEDNDVSAESLAEAYGLGLKSSSAALASPNDIVNHGLSSDIEIGKYVAMDCEMVGVGPGGHESVLARVSLVDFHGRQVYDSFVKPKERVTDWRTSVSGVSPKDMKLARDFEQVQDQVSDLLKDRVLVGHDIKHDLAVLRLNHPPRDIRDTARFPGFRKFGHGRKPALRVLARELLGTEIQNGPHSSIEDARVTMLLFRKQKPGFDIDHANLYAPKHATTGQRKGGVKLETRRRKRGS